MNRSAYPVSRPWPAQVELVNASERQVVGDDGTRIDLDAFRDACRTRAADLRQEAIADSRLSLRAGWGNAIRALRRVQREISVSMAS